MTDYMLPAVWLVFFLMAKLFERLCSISITFELTPKLMELTPKVMEITPKAWEIEIFFSVSLIHRGERLSEPDEKTPPPAFRPEWRSFDIYEIWTKFE